MRIRVNVVTWLSTRSKMATQLLVLLGLFLAVVALPSGLWDLRGPDEGRYAEVARELLGRKNWFALTVMDQAYDQKPPLAFWLIALGIKLSGGLHSWAMRLPSVLAAAGVVIFTYAMGKRLAGAATGYIAAFLLLSSLSFLDDAPVVELNMLFSFFITASISVWLIQMDQRRLSWPSWAILWLMLAAAFLVKGPLAILIVLSPLIGVAVARRSWQPFTSTRAIAGVALVLAVVAAWMLAQTHAWGNEFVEKQISSETVQRFLKGDHTQPFYYYFPRLFTAILGPWAFLLIGALVWVWKNRGQHPPGIAALVGWMAVPFITLILANGKRVPYLLPMIPAASLLAGWWAEQCLLHRKMKSGWVVAVFCLLGALVVMTATGGVLFLFPDMWAKNVDWRPLFDFSATRPWAWFLASAFMAVIFAGFRASERTWREGIWCIGLGILAVHAMDYISIKPALDPGKSTRSFSAAVQKVLQEHNETTLLALPEMAEPEYHVYGDYKLLYFKREDLDLSRTDLPKVLALQQKEIKTSSSAVLEAGFKPLMSLQVTKKPVELFVREQMPENPARN